MNREKVNYKVYFISDLHIAHKNILKYSPNRMKFVKEYKATHEVENDMEAHDNWIIEKIKATCQKGDHLYIIGDLILSSQEESIKILNKIKACGVKLHLVIGNHDRSTQRMFNMFETIDWIRVLNFHKENFPFIEEDCFQIVMCHFPIISWFNKARGSLHLFGHVHDNSPWLDEEENPNLMFNVGFDTPFSHYELISLEDVYARYKKKLKGLSPKDYIEKMSEENPKFIR